MGIFLVALLSICSFITASISAVAGMGGGIILLSILALLLAPSIVIPLHGAVQLISNSTRAFLLRSCIKLRIVTFYSLGLFVGVAICLLLFKGLDVTNFPLILISALIFYVVFKPARAPSINISMYGFTLLGLVCGFLTLFIGATGPLLAPFFLRDDLSKEEIIATKAAAQFITHLIKIPAFLYLGFNYGEYIAVIVILAISTVLGTKFGVMYLKRIDESLFRKIFKSALFLIALRLLYKYFSSL